MIQSPRANLSFLELRTEVKLWDVTTGRQLPLRLDGAVGRERVAALSPDGTRLAVTRGNHTITVWTLATGAAVTLAADSISSASGGSRLFVPPTPSDTDRSSARTALPSHAPCVGPRKKLAPGSADVIIGGR